MNKNFFRNHYKVCLLFLFLFFSSKGNLFADTACGSGAYCTGTNSYLKVDSCGVSSNGIYCENLGVHTVSMTCPVGGGGGSCVGSAPGKDGCQGLSPITVGTDCFCDDGLTSCSGDGSFCVNQSEPYGGGICTCYSGTKICPLPDQSTTLGCCLAGAYCGDGACNNGETCSSCPGDCGSCSGATNTPIPPTPVPSGNCGNGIVDSGETCSNCPQDVGACYSCTSNCCGNGHVDAGETCENCPADVGTCPVPPPVGDPPCTPSCVGDSCGQPDGCGNFCSDLDNRAPPAPTQTSPTDGAFVTMYDTTESGNPVKAVDISFTTQADVNYDAYYTYIDVYPVGTSCANALAKCTVLVSSGAGKNQPLTYTYTIPAANYGDYADFQWRVWHENATCSQLVGTASGWWTFTAVDTVSGSVLRDDGIAGLSGGVCTSPFSPVPYTPAGPETITVNYNGVDYTTSLNADGTWSVQIPVNNTGANSVAFSTNSGNPDVCGCPSGCSYSGINSPASSLTFYYQPFDVRDNWWQTIGGSVYGGQTTGTAVESVIPVDTCIGVNCLPYLNLQNDSNDGNSSGVAFTGGGEIDTSNSTGYQTDHIDEDGRNINAAGTRVDTLIENYAYFYRLYSMGTSPSNELGATPTKPVVASANGRAYYREGDMTINSAWSLGASESVVIFVHGNLTINNTITTPSGAFLAFIVSGNISIGSSVCQSDPASTTAVVQGVFVADGSLTVQSTGTGDCKFVGDGIYSALGGVQLNRDFRDGGAGDFLNAQHPSVVFRYRPDFVVNIPARMTRPLYQWQEVAP